MNKKYEKYINYIVNDLEIPYFFNMENQYGLRPDEYKLILSKVYNQPVRIKGKHVYNIDGNNLIYWENSNGSWEKYEYDTNGNIIYREYSNGRKIKTEYNDNGHNVYFENSDGSWFKKEYDTNGNEIYYESIDGDWVKYEYDTNGNLIYSEDSDGYIEDNR